MLQNQDNETCRIFMRKKSYIDKNNYDCFEMRQVKVPDKQSVI